MFNFHISSIIFIALGLAILGIMFHGLRAGYLYLYSMLLSHKAVHRVSNTFTNTAFTPFFVGEGSAERAMEPVIGFVESKVGSASSTVFEPGVSLAQDEALSTKQAATEYAPEVGDPGFAMPSTEEEWKLYDEPTYLRRGLFML